MVFISLTGSFAIAPSGNAVNISNAANAPAMILLLVVFFLISCLPVYANPLSMFPFSRKKYFSSKPSIISGEKPYPMQYIIIKFCFTLT